jgi:divalent metal cation (Fe/Co/Zn/Cd) transporter
VSDTTTPPVERLVARARWLARLTVGWNVVEAVVSIAAGAAAGSLALVGFGVDAGIETFSAVVVLWRLRGVSEEREGRALKLIAVSFFLLAGYVVVESVGQLVRGEAPDVAPVGIAITGLSLIVMPLLARAKQRVGRAMDSRVVLADAAETWLCTYLSVVVLAGLLLNALLGWWWADPVAALYVAYLAVREGREAWEGDDD